MAAKAMQYVMRPVHAARQPEGLPLPGRSNSCHAATLSLQVSDHADRLKTHVFKPPASKHLPQMLGEAQNGKTQSDGLTDELAATVSTEQSTNFQKEACQGTPAVAAM